MPASFSASTLIHIVQTYFPKLSIPDFIDHQRSDKRLASIITTLSKKDHLNYCIFHDILCKTKEVPQHNNRHVIVYTIMCPDQLALQLLQKAHIQQLVHFNFSRLQNKLRAHWNIRNFAEVYREMIDLCQFCALNVPQPHKPPYQTLPVFYGLYDAISIDHCVLNSSWEIDGFLNITEQFSTYITLIPLKSTATA